MPHISSELSGVYLELTDRCLNHCSYCYNSSSCAEINELPISQVISLLQYVSAEGNCILSGGEPLLYSGFADVIQMAERKKLHTCIITSGNVSLDGDLSRLIVNHQPEIQLTLDAEIAEVHNRTRGHNAFEKQMAFLKHIRDKGWDGKLSIRMNYYSGNRDRIEKVLLLCKDLQVSQMTISPVFPLGRGTKFSEAYSELDTVEHEMYLSSLEVAGHTSDASLRAIVHFDYCRIAGCSLALDDVPQITPRVSVTGDIYPCQAFHSSEYIIGNILQDSIESILSGEIADRLLTEIRQRQTKIKKCTNCSIAFVCKGGCPGKADVYNHRLDAPGLSCSVAKTKTYESILSRSIAKH